MKKFLWIVPVLSALLLAGCGLSLAEDITPPPNYVSPTLAAEQPVEARTVYPILPPDPAQGQAIYAEKCLPCHGATGLGDGPQAANLPNPAAPIGNPDLARQSKPVDWYQTVTQGNLEKFMPGFSQGLNDRQRWDVVAYVYTLSTTPEALAQGKQVYDSECASCHGAEGKGDGPQAAGLSSKTASWADQSLLADLSTNEMVGLIQQGKGEMPGYQGKLDDSQSLAVAYYIRTLSYASPVQPAEALAAVETQPAAETPAGDTTPSAETPQAGATAVAGTPGVNTTPAAPQKITVTGKVTNGTPGGTVPGGLQAQLTAFADMNPAFETSADVAADGTYRFEDVEFNDNYVYFVRVTVGDLTFNSNILHAKDIQGEQADLPVEIYDTTSDASVLRTDRLHIFFDFSQPGKVQVVNLYIISNPSGKMVVPSGPGKATVNFELPNDATNLQFQDSQIGERYIQTDTGFGDTAAIQPGEAGVNQVLFAYDLPYDSALSYSMKVPLPVQAATVMMPFANIELNSDQLSDAGQRDVQGTSFHMYQAKAALNAGDTIDLTLKGKPGTGAAAAQNPNNALIFGAGAFGLVLIVAGVWLYRQRRQQELAMVEGEAAELAGEPSETSESILEAIVALDDQHASGGLPEAAYQQRRAELKSRLGDALAREKGG